MVITIILVTYRVRLAADVAELSVSIVLSLKLSEVKLGALYVKFTSYVSVNFN